MASHFYIGARSLDHLAVLPPVPRAASAASDYVDHPGATVEVFERASHRARVDERDGTEVGELPDVIATFVSGCSSFFASWFGLIPLSASASRISRRSGVRYGLGGDVFLHEALLASADRY